MHYDSLPPGSGIGSNTCLSNKASFYRKTGVKIHWQDLAKMKRLRSRASSLVESTVEAASAPLRGRVYQEHSRNCRFRVTGLGKRITTQPPILDVVGPAISMFYFAFSQVLESQGYDESENVYQFR